jgi:PAS domain S-box-containing protein
MKNLNRLMKAALAGVSVGIFLTAMALPAEGEKSRISYESIIRDIPYDAWQRYGCYILAGLGIMIFEGFLVVWLLRRQRLSQRKNEQSEASFKAFFDLAPYACAVNDMDGHYLITNQSFCRQVGYSEQELLGHTGFELGLLSDKESSRKVFEELTRTGEAIGKEAIATSKGGEVLHALYSSRIIELGPRKVILSITVDITERKRAEKALMKSEAKLHEEQKFRRLLLDASPAFIVAIGFDGKTLMMNPSLLAALEYTAEEIVETDYLTSFIPEEDREMLSEVFRKIVTEGKATVNENRIRGRSGRTFLVEWHGRTVSGEEAGSGFFVGVGIDITERKRTEEALRQNERRLSFAISATFDAVWEWNLVTNETYYSPRWYEMLGYADKQFSMTFEAFRQLCHPDDYQPTIDRIQMMLESRGNIGYQAEFRMRAQDGSWLWILGRGNVRERDATGKPLSLSGTNTNITERKRVEAVLRESEERNRRITQCVPDLVWTIDLSGRFTYANASVERTHGWTVEEVMKLTFREMVTPRQALKAAAMFEDDVRKAMEPHYDHNSIRTLESEELRKDGSVFWAEVNAAFLWSDDGKPMGIIGITRNITERKRAEEALRRSDAEIRQLNAELELRVSDRTAQLQKANQELESFSYSVSHDLRTPLRHIAGYVNLLNAHAGAALDEEGHRLLGNVAEASKRMGRLIDDLLTFSRISRAQMRLGLISMNQLVEECRQELAPDLKERRIEWVIPALPEVPGDRALIKQVLLNLLGNAVKYTRKRADARIEVGFEMKESEWQFNVRDNGIGFNMKYVSKLFGVFQRLHSDAEFEGTGIGLANVRRVILRHGGRTWAEGEINRGAVFCFTLPRNATTNG